jgi:hypothetical protein
MAAIQALILAPIDQGVMRVFGLCAPFPRWMLWLHGYRTCL